MANFRNRADRRCPIIGVTLRTCIVFWCTAILFYQKALAARVSCPIGWKRDPNSNYCYRIFDEQASWKDAKVGCGLFGKGTLASITSKEEMDFITSQLTGKTQHYWTGGNDFSEKGRWAWLDGQPFPYINWFNGNSDSPVFSQSSAATPNKDCIAITLPSGRWVSAPCTNRIPYVCKILGTGATSTVPPMTTPSNLPVGKVWSCPLHWKGYMDSCFSIVTTTKTIAYDEASTACEAQGANLAYIRDSDENKYIHNLINKGGKSAWIGMTNWKHPNTFTWMDGHPTTYTNWAKYEPSGTSCVLMNVKDGAWETRDCNKRFQGYVCKKTKTVIAKASASQFAGCRKGDQAFEDKCYKIHTDTKKTYYHALQKCKSSLGGTLVAIPSSLVQDSLSAYLKASLSTNVQDIWIGLTSSPYFQSEKTTQEEPYSWTSGSPVGYTNWDSKHTGQETGTCVVLLNSGTRKFLWHDSNCDTKHNFICQYPRIGASPPPPSPHLKYLPCKSDWIEVSDSNICYKYFIPTSEDKMLKWTAANNYCGQLERGGTLATIPSADISTALRTDFIRRNNADKVAFWIGLSKNVIKDDGFVWADGAPFLYQNWSTAISEATLIKQSCTVWRLDTNDWAPHDCASKGYFMCQMAREPTIPSITTTTATASTTPVKKGIVTVIIDSVTINTSRKPTTQGAPATTGASSSSRPTSKPALTTRSTSTTPNHGRTVKPAFGHRAASSSHTDNNGLSTPAIVGIVVGVLVLGLAVMGGVCVAVRRGASFPCSGGPSIRERLHEDEDDDIEIPTKKTIAHIRY